MLVQEAGDQALELGGLPRLSHGNGVIKELVLDVGRQIIPLHDDRSAQAAQKVLILPAQRDRAQELSIDEQGTGPGLSWQGRISVNM